MISQRNFGTCTRRETERWPSVYRAAKPRFENVRLTCCAIAGRAASSAAQLRDEGQQLGRDTFWHLGMRVVPCSVDDQTASTKLGREPPRFGDCVREVRIVAAHDDEGRHSAGG